MSKFPHYTQTESKDCGPTCLKIIAKHYGRLLNIQTLRELAETTREGSNLLTLSDAAESIGFRTLGVKLCVKDLQETPLPCILHCNKNQYVVLYKIKKDKYYVSDHVHGLLEYNEIEFIYSSVFKTNKSFFKR
jgi:ATP-binding cassette subfamily B protein